MGSEMSAVLERRLRELIGRVGEVSDSQIEMCIHCKVLAARQCRREMFLDALIHTQASVIRG